MRFSKWHGLGQRLPARRAGELAVPLTPERVRRICDYHFGVGSDGILEVVSADGDGGRRRDLEPRRLDGRAVRQRHADRGPLARAPARRATQVTDPRRAARGRRTHCSGDARSSTRWAQVEVGEPETIDVGGEDVEFTPVSVGNPHAVIRREPDRAELLRLGPLVETHERFPERTNVQLVRVDGDARADRRRLGARGGGDALVRHERGRGGARPWSRTAGARARSPSISPAVTCSSSSRTGRRTLTGPGRGDLHRRARRGVRPRLPEIREAPRRGPAVPVRRARAQDRPEAARGRRRDQSRHRRPRPADAGAGRRARSPRRPRPGHAPVPDQPRLGRVP